MIAIYSVYGQIELGREIISFDATGSRTNPSSIETIVLSLADEVTMIHPEQGAKLTITGQNGNVVAEYAVNVRETGNVPVLEWFFVTNG